MSRYVAAYIHGCGKPGYVRRCRLNVYGKSRGFAAEALRAYIRRVYAAQKLLRLFQNMTIMSFVCRIQQFIMLAQHHALDGGATDVKTYSHLVFPPKDK